MMPNEIMVEIGEGTDYDCLGAHEWQIVKLHCSLAGLKNAPKGEWHLAYQTWWSDTANDVRHALERLGLEARTETETVWQDYPDLGPDTFYWHFSQNRRRWFRTQYRVFARPEVTR